MTVVCAVGYRCTLAASEVPRCLDVDLGSPVLPARPAHVRASVTCPSACTLNQEAPRPRFCACLVPILVAQPNTAQPLPLLQARPLYTVVAPTV